MDFIKGIWTFYLMSLIIIFSIGYTFGNYLGVTSEPESGGRFLGAFIANFTLDKPDHFYFEGVLVDLNNDSTALKDLK